MKRLTDGHPKCLTELGGRPLLHWQLDALRQGGVDTVAVVSGYLGQMLDPAGLGLPPRSYYRLTNEEWERTNMLSSLMQAGAWLEDQFAKGCSHAIISYSDIVYHPSHVADLSRSSHDLAITFDTLWESLWRLRFGDPLYDAEVFSQSEGVLKRIGGRPGSLAEVEGQYMGLVKVSPVGWQTIKRLCHNLGQAVPRTDMTGMLALLLERRETIGVIPVRGRWCEIDSGEDLTRYREALRESGWTHDWRW